MPDAGQVFLITHCINTIDVLPDRSRALLREILAAIQAGNLGTWGAMNIMRAQEVFDLFQFCELELARAHAA